MVCTSNLKVKVIIYCRPTIGRSVFQIIFPPQNILLLDLNVFNCKLLKIKNIYCLMNRRIIDNIDNNL